MLSVALGALGALVLASVLAQGESPYGFGYLIAAALLLPAGILGLLSLRR